MLLSNKRKCIRMTLVPIVFVISALTSSIHTCEDTKKQVNKKEKAILTENDYYANSPLTYNNVSKSSGEINVAKEKTKKAKQVKNTVKLASNRKPYVYYEVYDFFYDSNEYHSLDCELQEYTYELCIEYGIEEFYTLILCQLYYESKYNTNAVSQSGDYGIAQINECNFDWLSQELGVTNFLDAKQSITCNIYMMSDYLKKYSVESSLFCYNTGSPNGSNAYSENITYMWNNGVREIKE